MGHFRECLDLIEGQGSRADEAHVAFDHIEELRQFVDAEFAKPFAERKNARVTIEFEDGTAHFVAVFLFDLIEQILSV